MDHLTKWADSGGMTNTTATTRSSNSPQETTNADAVKRLVDEVVNQGRYETIAEVVHPSYRYHGPGGVEAEGPGGAQQLIAEFRAGLSDLHAEITSEIAQGELVALTMLMTGTHDGDLMGIAPTGAAIELPMAIVSRVDGGRIVEEWEYFDSATIISQLGV